MSAKAQRPVWELILGGGRKSRERERSSAVEMETGRAESTTICCNDSMVLGRLGRRFRGLDF